MHQIVFGSLGELTALHQTPSCIEGRERGGEWDRWGSKREGEGIGPHPPYKSPGSATSEYNGK